MKKTSKQKRNSIPVSASEFEKTAVKVSLVSIIGNAVLSFFKILAGILANSGAMISDAIHSASDVFSSIIVIIGVKFSAKKSDKDHPYGHERFECVAAIVLAVILLICGLFIGHTAIEKIGTEDAQQVTVPGILALVAAIIAAPNAGASGSARRHIGLSENTAATMPVQRRLFDAPPEITNSPFWGNPAFSKASITALASKTALSIAASATSDGR